MRLDDLPEHTQAELLAREGEPRPKKKSARSAAADLFDFHLRSHRLSGWTREHMFAQEFDGRTPTGKRRQWRFDFANLELKLAVEIDGLVVMRMANGRMVSLGRHTDVAGFKEDCRKKAAAVELGWYVLSFEQTMVKSGEAIAAVERVLARRGVARG